MKKETRTKMELGFKEKKKTRARRREKKDSGERKGDVKKQRLDGSRSSFLLVQ